MQNAELYRQGVVLPLDHQAENCLRSNDVDLATSVRVVEIASDAVFADLVRLKLFERINARCATLIDEYEEEWVDASATQAVLTEIDLVAGTAHDPATLAFLAELRVLVVEAHAISRPLLFVL